MSKLSKYIALSMCICLQAINKALWITFRYVGPYPEAICEYKSVNIRKRGRLPIHEGTM